ncbi:MAG: DUF433 domain-containing protein [Cyanobacteria bacterium P01_H01_bin.35]
MTSPSNQQKAIAITERGLTITGTRITIYDIMDYLTAQYPPQFIRSMLSLTDEQLQAALSYIEAHRPEVEAEYQKVLQEAEALQKYWEAQNSTLFARIATTPPKPGTEAIRAKLQKAKAKLGSQV